MLLPGIGPLVGMMGGAESGPEMLAARFNGTGMLATGGIGGGVTDSNTFICSFWVRFRQDNSTQVIFRIRGSNPSTNEVYNGFHIWRANNNKLNLQAWRAGGQLILHSWTTERTFTVADGWVHVYAFRGSYGTDSGVWINNEPLISITPTNNSDIEFTQSNMYFARSHQGASTDAAVADIAEFYLIPNPGVLPTNQGVRDHFVRGTGANCRPVMNQGFSSNWSLPTPHVYLSADNQQFRINQGRGNNFSSFPANATYVPSGKFYVQP